MLTLQYNLDLPGGSNPPGTSNTKVPLSLNLSPLTVQNMDKFTFFDLRVYQESKQLVKDVYLLLEKFSKFEVYALGDQLRRAVVSVPSNIAEGSGRSSIKEKVHFILNKPYSHDLCSKLIVHSKKITTFALI